MASRRRAEFYSDTDFTREVTETSGLGPEPYRSGFRKDYARLIHSPAFRRLQRKTQLFPGDESDFFRNRITHSLEVAQIAKSIAIRLNYLMAERGIKTDGIDTDLVEFAALAHDLGHPPFGHTGEHALDDRMRDFGGFEGNAQTFRILTRLEKKRTKYAHSSLDGMVEFQNGVDFRAGLNITYRGLAAILKYDNAIPEHRTKDQPLAKGYYASESEIIRNIRKAVGRSKEIKPGHFKTIEMQIMDLADDIAYSTYDFEDALKAEFTSPLDLLSQVNSNEDVRNAVAKKLFKSRHGRSFPEKNESSEDIVYIDKIKVDMEESVLNMFIDVFVQIEDMVPYKGIKTKFDRSLYLTIASINAQKMSRLAQTSGYNRTALTSEMVGRRIQAVDINLNEAAPAFSEVVISSEERFDIDVMKHLTYELHIRSQRLRVIESRGKQIVGEIFDCLAADADGDLLPSDWRARLAGMKGGADFAAQRMRLICDFIAGMTDAYALDFYARLKSANPSILFRPM